MFDLKLLPQDPIFGVMAAWKADPNPQKVNLGIGIYRGREGHPFVFSSIAKAATTVARDNFEYELMNGNRTFLHHTGKLFLGDFFNPEQWAVQQSCGGTHACRIFGDVCFRAHESYKLLVGTPTWANHYGLFKGADWVEFPHLNENQEINMPGYAKAIKENPGTIILLQGGPTHNPIGINFTESQWREIASLCRKSKVKIFVDFAYLGFGDGIESDRKCLRIMYEEGCDFAFGVSYSKNASLYSERLGGLFIRVKDEAEKKRIESQTYRIIRKSISCLPQYGARIMNKIFDQSKSQWLSQLEDVRQDIASRRDRFIDMLPSRFEYMRQSRGMFGMMYLSEDKVMELKEKYSIYLTADSRVNFAGIRDQDYEYLAEVLPKILN